MPISKFINDFYLEQGFTQEKIDKLAPDDWVKKEPNNDYLKAFYDIKELDGTIHLEKWPNAGMFALERNRYIEVKEVLEWKLSNKNYFNK